MASNRDQRKAGDTRALLQGLIFGALAGGVVALWKAPRSGRALRAELRRGGQALVQNVEDTAAQARRQIAGESVEEVMAAAKAEARRLNRR
ncbi:MAG: YtxH domain-containing protein [Anaerolineae bacterium]|nr:YtxH domain-containing protein [Anaerolineae bacterium]